MILQALYEYYQRKAADPSSNVAPEGWEWKEIPYLIVINKKGNFVSINNTREGEGKIKRARRFLVPQSDKRSVGIKAYLLWDNIEYALGANPRKRKDIKRRHNAFKERITNELTGKDIPSLKSLEKFLENEPLEQIKKSRYADLWKEIMEENPFIAFKIDGESHSTICDDFCGMELSSSSTEKNEGICLVTGNTDVEIARLHPDIKGVRGTNTKGATLVAFNLPAFESYNKSQNYNAPISRSAAFAYTTGLNILLGKDSQNKVTIGGSTTVFWAEKRKLTEQNYDLENNFAWFVTDKKDDPDRGVQAVKSLYESYTTGSLSASKERFYVLGLSPNAARISVRFFRQGTICEFGEKIKLHFDDFEIARAPFDPEYLSLYRILTATALQYKMENVPPNLAGAVIESILDGTPYPLTLLHQCMRRIRAEQNVTRARAAILKATINRFNRIHKSQEKEITMALDPTNKNPGYRLGRLFATLEKIQEEANPNINTTIRDRFYSSASTCPVAVFSQLLRLKNHHIPKLDTGRKIYFEKLIGEIKCELSEYPPHLALNEQAFFSLGYYHQRQDFFTKKADKENSKS